MRKSKKAPISTYRLTEGAEPKLLAVREMLTVYRDVYLKHKELRGSELLEKGHAQYLGRRRGCVDQDIDSTKCGFTLLRALMKSSKFFSLVSNAELVSFPWNSSCRSHTR